MRKIRTTAVGLALLAGLFGIMSPAASAAPVTTQQPAQVSEYTYSISQWCWQAIYAMCVEMGIHTTSTATQIWINGKVSCIAKAGFAISWCGVGGGNGTATLNFGMNVVGQGLGGGYDWFRMNLYANGAGCYRWWGGPNSQNFLTGFGAVSACEQPA